MRIPKIKKRMTPEDKQIRVIDVSKYDLPTVVFCEDVDFDDPKSVERYVKTIKFNIRHSPEYKRLMAGLKNRMNLNKCFFLPNMKKFKKGDKLTIEMHHTGFVIEDIIKTILWYKYDEGEDYSIQNIGKEVMFHHYNGDISLTPLSSTAHELIHEEDSMLFIPLHMAGFGDMNKFYEEYKDTIRARIPDLYKKFEQYKILSETVENIDDIIPEYLDVNMIYYNVEGVEIPTMDKILEILNLNEVD